MHQVGLIRFSQKMIVGKDEEVSYEVLAVLRCFCVNTLVSMSPPPRVGGGREPDMGQEGGGGGILTDVMAFGEFPSSSPLQWLGGSVKQP